MSDRFTIALNLTNAAPSQYLEEPFDSVVEFNGKLIFFGPTGVFEEGGQTDNGTTISAWIDTPLHDFGDGRQKRIEAYDVGYETYGNLIITLYADEDVNNARSFMLAPAKPSQVQQGMTMTLTRSLYGDGRYHKVRIANVSGCDFSLDYIALAPVFLDRRGRRRGRSGPFTTLTATLPSVTFLGEILSEPSMDFSQPNNSQYLL